MKDGTSDVGVKAAVAAVVVYATVMGSIGAYWSLQCGRHWFTYSVLSLLPYTVPATVIVFLLGRWILSEYDFGRVRHWLIVGAVSVAFFLACFVFAHLQPDMQLFSGVDCEPF